MNLRFGAHNYYYRATKVIPEGKLNYLNVLNHARYPGSQFSPVTHLNPGDTVILKTPGNKPEIERSIRLDAFFDNTLGKLGLQRYEPLDPPKKGKA